MPITTGAPASHHPSLKVNWSQVGILYGREMRAAFRERTIVINSVLIPIFLYPLLLWIAFTGITYIAGQTEGAKLRIALVDRSPIQAQSGSSLARAFELDPNIQLLPTSESLDRLLRRIQLGQIDASLELLPATNTAALL